MNQVEHAVTSSNPQQMHQIKAQILWNEFDQDKRALVRFGMFPSEEMLSAVELGFDATKLAVELMNCAKKDGGMCA